MKRQTIFIQLAVILAIIVVVNLISGNLYLRLDFTADKRYTLSNATKDILNELEDVITVKAFFSEDLPPQLLSTRNDFREQLIEYENRSGGNIIYEFVNPNESEEKERDAQQQGIQPLVINVTERDQVKQQRAYMGAILQMGERSEIIPLIQPGAGMEYALTTAIKKIAVESKPKLAFVQGHGEPPPAASAQLLEQLSVLYDVEPFTITDTTDIPGYYRALAIIDPKDTVPASHFAKLDRYLQGNGGIYVAYSNVSGDLNSGFLRGANDIGIRGWLADKGVMLGDQLVIDAACASIGVRQQQGPFILNTQVQFPYFPIASQFADHPISKGIESLLLPLVSTVTYQGPDSAVQYSSLAMTSDRSGLVNSPVYIDINKEWTASDFPSESQPVAIAVNGPLGGATDAKLVVVGNGNFAVNGEGQQQQQVNQDNINFASNALDWLSDDTGLVDLRTKGVTNRPLDPVEDGTKSILKYGNVFFPIILILIYALIRKQQYMRKRQNWLQGNY